MDKFKLRSDYKPTGDQPEAIKTIKNNILNGVHEQVLLGATGTGKTFTMANVITQVNKPTIIMAPNKTLAGQLFSEMKELFPDNHVEYFISYYDYYQPEAYVVSSDTYIEKDSSINDEIDEMRHSATAALMDYKDVIVVASVSCIYGMGDPEEYKNSMLCIRAGEEYDRTELLGKLVTMQYARNDYDLTRGSFRMRGDSLEIIPNNEHEHGIKVDFFDQEVESVKLFDVVTGKTIERRPYVNLFAATHFVTNADKLEEAMRRIKNELIETKASFLKEQKHLEAERIEQRTIYDLEMLGEMGTCSGVENYSRHMSLRDEGETPSTLLDFFPDDFLMIIDEAHVTVPQIGGMYKGDRARKLNLVNYGFRLKSALDNRPLKFDEFQRKVNDVVYLSATPGKYEIENNLPIVQQIIRPTGLLDPIIEIRPSEGQVDDIYAEIVKRMELNERVLITTLTIKMSEDLSKYLTGLGLSVAYIHSKIKALERLEILRDLRLGKYDVLVGINLLREGIDLPEVSLVCILDANKQGFLRSNRSLVQTIGRAARNSNGRVIMYADSVSDSMKYAIKETSRRREIQMEYNRKNNIIPTTIIKKIHDTVSLSDSNRKTLINSARIKAEDKEKLISELEAEMNDYASNLDFESAAQIRDVLIELKGKKKKRGTRRAFN